VSRRGSDRDSLAARYKRAAAAHAFSGSGDANSAISGTTGRSVRGTRQIYSIQVDTDKLPFDPEEVERTAPALFDT